MTYPDFAALMSRIQPTLAGWCVKEKAEVLASLVIGTRPELVVEIGIYGGSSAFPLALALKYVGRGLLIAIDPWDKQAALEVQTTQADRDHWMREDMEAHYQNFMRLLKNYELGPFVKVERKKSDHVGVPTKIDILNIDGGHSDQAVKDAVRFAPHVVVGGYCLLDDLKWAGGGPQRAEAFILQRGFKKLMEIDTGGIYQRVY